MHRSQYCSLCSQIIEPLRFLHGAGRKLGHCVEIAIVSVYCAVIFCDDLSACETSRCQFALETLGGGCQCVEQCHTHFGALALDVDALELAVLCTSIVSRAPSRRCEKIAEDMSVAASSSRADWSASTH